MNEILRRRRSLIAKPKDILYQISNYAFNNEYIDTGIQLLLEDIDWSMVYDININTNPASGIGSTMSFMVIRTGATVRLRIGKYSAGSNIIMYVYMSNSNYQQTTNMGTGRFRFVLQRPQGRGLTIYINKDTGDISTKYINNAFVSRDANLILGGAWEDSQYLPTGTLNTVKVYKRLLTTNEINSFLEGNI